MDEVFPGITLQPKFTVNQGAGSRLQNIMKKCLPFWKQANKSPIQ